MQFQVRNPFVFFLAIFLASFFGIGVGRLNAQAATGTIQGTVTDATGAAVPAATVQVKNLGTGVTQTVMSDAQGRYLVPDLGVGEYEVQASKTGFTSVVHRGITLTVGAQSVVDFSLPVGQQQQTVTVEGEATAVDTTTAAVGTYTSELQMRDLPLNGRNFEQLIQLAPGVTTFNMTTNALQGRAPQYSVAGSRPEGQAILLDDENLQSFWNNGMGSITGTSLGVEAIGEFQTLTNSYGAQFGGNGAVINAVSKSGANAFHGSAFDFIRNSSLDAKDFFATIAPAFRRNQFGGSLGGPIKKDKAFFFVDYEGIRQLLQENKVAIVPNCPAVCTPITSANGVATPAGTNPAVYQAIVNTLAIYPRPTTLLSSTTGTVPQYGNQINHEDYGLGRFDYVFSEKDSIFLRYLVDRASFLEPFGGSAVSLGGGPLPFWHQADGSQNQFATLEERHIFSPTVVNTARVSFSRPTKNSNETTIAEINGTTPLQFFPGVAGLEDGFVSIPGYTGLGGASSQVFYLNENRYTGADDILWTLGAHSIRFGIAVARLQANTWNPITEDAQWSFNSLTSFLEGEAASVRGAIPGPQNDAYRDYRQTDVDPYFQDDWKVNAKLTLNLGLRWDFMTDPTETHDLLYAITNFATATSWTQIPNVFLHNPSWHNFDPRFGLAYDPFANHKTSIRAGFGIFHDPITAQDYQTGFGAAPPWNVPQQISPVYPFAFASAPATPAPTSSFGWDPNIRTTPYQMQYNFNIQREIAPSTVLTVGYIGSRGVHLFSEIENNPPIPTFINGAEYFGTLSATGTVTPNPRINPHLGTFETLEPLTSSNYNSLQVILNRRFTRNVQAQFNYTYSKCLDYGAFGVGSFNGSGTPSQVENPYNQSIDYGPCGYDITHVIRANGLYALPFHGNRFVEGWQLSGIVSWNTGLAFNADTGFDQAGFQLQSGPERPNYVLGCNPYAGAHTVSEWFNPNCYTLQPVGTLGNTGRDTLRGPGLFDTDIALLKDTNLTEKLRLQFRAEFFNIFNHPNFALPNNSLFSQPSLALEQANGGVTAAPTSSAGVITASNPATTPREIQFALKFIF